MKTKIFYLVSTTVVIFLLYGSYYLQITYTVAFIFCGMFCQHLLRLIYTMDKQSKKDKDFRETLVVYISGVFAALCMTALVLPENTFAVFSYSIAALLIGHIVGYFMFKLHSKLLLT